MATLGACIFTPPLNTLSTLIIVFQTTGFSRKLFKPMAIFALAITTALELPKITRLQFEACGHSVAVEHLHGI